MMRDPCKKNIPLGVINLVKMQALAELVLGQILSLLCPWGVRQGLCLEYNLNTEVSHLVLFNAALQ